MRTNSDSMLLKFRSKDTRFGVTRDTVKALADQLDTSETAVVHMALSKLAEEMLPAYERDASPLSSQQLSAIKRIATKSMPKGKVTKSQSLF